MSELGKLYPDILLEHHRAPRRSGRLEAPTHSAEGSNPLCGDRVGVTLAVGEGRLLDIRCEVKGCAICRAAGSMMAEAVVGLELPEVSDLLRRFVHALGEPPGEQREDLWGPLSALLEARRFPNRRRCASLSWEVLERALENPNGR
jgi:nitrogen fixation NifU-like protein